MFSELPTLIERSEDTTVSAAVATDRTPLTAADRCDRCGARAYVRVILSSGGELLFCAHHARQHADSLRAVAADIQDETEELTDTPSSEEPADQR
jgi:hypothetical protein